MPIYYLLTGSHPRDTSCKPGQHGFYLDCCDEYGNRHTAGGAVKIAVVKGAGHLAIGPVLSLNAIQSCVTREDSKCEVTHLGSGRYSLKCALFGAGSHPVLVTNVQGKTECLTTVSVTHDPSPWPLHCWLDPDNTYESPPFRQYTCHIYLYDRYFNPFKAKTLHVAVYLDSHFHHGILKKASEPNRYVIQFTPQVTTVCCKLKISISDAFIGDEPKTFKIQENNSFKDRLVNFRRTLSLSRHGLWSNELVTIDRSNLLESALENQNALKCNRFRIRFLYENGIDEGALSRYYI